MNVCVNSIVVVVIVVVNNLHIIYVVTASGGLWKSRETEIKLVNKTNCLEYQQLVENLIHLFYNKN